MNQQWFLILIFSWLAVVLSNTHYYLNIIFLEHKMRGNYKLDYLSFTFTVTHTHTHTHTHTSSDWSQLVKPNWEGRNTQFLTYTISIFLENVRNSQRVQQNTWYFDGLWILGFDFLFDLVMVRNRIMCRQLSMKL